MSDETWMLRIKVARLEDALRAIAAEDPMVDANDLFAIHAFRRVQAQAHWALKDFTSDEVNAALEHTRRCRDARIDGSHCGVCGARREVVRYLDQVQERS